jgi:hypothetical protein
MVFKFKKHGMMRGHSRGIDKTVRTAVDEDIIDEGSRKSTANRSQNRGPDPVLTAIIEDCTKNGLGTLDWTDWVGRTLPPVTNHCGHNAGTQITCRIDGASYGQTVKEDEMTVEDNMPVCIPNATETAKIERNTTNGTSQPGGGEFLLSVTENISSSRMNAPMNLTLLH